MKNASLIIESLQTKFCLLQDFTIKIQQYFSSILLDLVRLKITNMQLCMVVNYAANDIT